MKALTTLLIFSILLNTTPSAAAPTEPELNVDVPEATVETLDAYGIYGADSAQEAEITAAMAVLADNGLTVPELRIYVHESNQGCRENQGLFGTGGDKHRVDICNFDESIIRHELVHAWEHHNMDDSTRQAFQDHIGLDNWNDHDQPHYSRGIEEAAYLIVWGMDDNPISRMSRNHYADDLTGYELLTGTASPRISHWNDEAGSAPSLRPLITPCAGSTSTYRIDSCPTLAEIRTRS